MQYLGKGTEPFPTGASASGWWTTPYGVSGLDVAVINFRGQRWYSGQICPPHMASAQVGCIFV